MTYTKAGPFTNGSTTPPINAAFLNAVESDLVTKDSTITALTSRVATLETGAATPQTASSGTGWFFVDDYGAKGDGISNDRAAIQAAVDAAHVAYTTTFTMQRVYFGPRVYRVGAAAYYASGGTQSGIVSIFVQSGIELCGPGQVKVLDGQYGAGALYSIVRAADSGISDFAITDLTFHGNRSGNVTSNQCGNILINSAVSNIRIRNVKSYEANGNSIMVTGTFTTPATDVVIEDCRVGGANTIGIQVSQFNGIIIHNNSIESTSDNGIDIYGENQGSTVSNGINWKITDNKLRYNGNGIFPETVAHGIVANNMIADPVNHGIHVNRINGQPENILIIGNSIQGGHASIGLTGDMANVTIRGNDLEGADQAGVLLGGAGNVSGIFIDSNTINAANVTTPLVLCAAGTSQLTRTIHRNTITNSTNRSYDGVSYAATTVGNTWQPALSPGS